MVKTRKRDNCRHLIHTKLATVIIGIMIACPVLALDDSGVYRVGPDDVVNVTVARHPEFSGEFYVPADGKVSMQAAGQVMMSGKTLSQIAETVRAQLLTRLRKPDVTVILRSPSKHQIYVTGAVSKPGAYEMKPDWRCSEAIAAAGGIAENLKPTECKAILRKGLTGQSLTLDLTSALQGDVDSNPVIESGDIISIDGPEMISVSVTGKVRNPGLYKLRKDNSSIIEALALAGGEQENSAMDRVSVTHKSGLTEVCNLISNLSGRTSAANIVLQPMDVILVPEETARVAVLGYVNSPGFFALSNAQGLRLVDILGQAKGTDKRGNLSSIVIIRSDSGEQQRLTYNTTKFLKSGDVSQNPVLQAGDVVYVPQTGKQSLNEVIGAAAALALTINPLLR